MQVRKRGRPADEAEGSEVRVERTDSSNDRNAEAAGRSRRSGLKWLAESTNAPTQVKYPALPACLAITVLVCVCCRYITDQGLFSAVVGAFLPESHAAAEAAQRAPADPPLWN